MNTAIQLTDLTPTEQEIAHLSCWGYTQKEIAAMRHRSFYTINNELRQMHEKAECRNQTEFTAWYFCSLIHCSRSINHRNTTIYEHN